MRRDNSFNTMPALYIGLGQSGKFFLDELSLCVSKEEQKNTRSICLCIDDRETSESSHSYISKNGTMNQITYCLNKNQAKKIAEKDKFFDWYLNGGFSEKSRLDGRLSYVFITKKNNDQKLKNLINETLDYLKVNSRNRLMVYLITSLYDQESAFIGDLLVDLFQMINKAHIGLVVPILITGEPSNKGNSKPGEIVAGLREFERLKIGGPQNLLGINGENLSQSDEIYFNQVILLDDHSKIAPFVNSFNAMLSRDFINTFLSDYANIPASPYFCFLNCLGYSVKLPIEQIRNYLTHTAALDILFNSEDIFDIPDLVKAFLSGNARKVNDNWLLFTIVDQVLNEQDVLDLWIELSEEELISVFTQELELFLIENFSFSPKSAVEFLKFLDKQMEKSKLGMKRLKNGAQNFDQILPVLRKMIGQLIKITESKLKESLVIKNKIQLEAESIRLDLSESQGKETNFNRTIVIQKDVLLTSCEKFFSNHIPWIKDKIKKSHKWKWVSIGAGEADVLYQIDEKIYDQFEHIYNHLLNMIYPLTKVVENDFDFFLELRHLGRENIEENISHIEPFVSFDPNYLQESRTLKYLIAPEKSFINSLNLPNEIKICNSVNKFQLTYLEFDFNIPIDGLHKFQQDKQSYFYQNEKIHIYTHEQQARIFEEQYKKYSKNLGTDIYFPAQLVRFMGNETAFKTLMWCLFFDWVIKRPNQFGEQHWWFSKDEIRFPLGMNGFPAIYLEHAVENFLLKIPAQELSGVHALSSRNMDSTIKDINQKIIDERNLPYSSRENYYPKIKQKIINYKRTKNPFLEGLGLYLEILVETEKIRKDNVREGD